jgi:hypothetical protein
VKTVTDGDVQDYDMDAVSDLLADVTEPDNDDNRRRVRKVDSVKPHRHGIIVTLTVQIPTRTKGMVRMGDTPDTRPVGGDGQ